MTVAAQLEQRTLPHNLEAEKALLGAILLHNEVLNEIIETVQAKHFYRDAHRRLFQHMCGLSMQNSPIDMTTLRESLTKAGDFEEVGGPSYVSALIDGMPHRANVKAYAQIVRDRSDLRAVIHAASKLASAAYAAEESAFDIVASAERTIFELVEECRPRGGFVSVGDILPGIMEKIETLCADRQIVTGIPSGYQDLDEMTHGFQNGDLVLIAARPSMGKTALAVNIADHVSGPSVNKTVGVFSLEMSSESLVMRDLAGKSRIDSMRLATGYLNQREIGRIAIEVSAMQNAKLFIDDSPNLTVFEMRARARRLMAEHGLSLLIVDYLQLAASPEETRRSENNRVLEVAAMSRGLKALARELKVPVIVLSQLSRAPETRSDHRPQLSDLRESGALEQDADVVIFVYRDEYYFPKSDAQGVAELIIGKQRQGPTGSVKLAFIREYTRFENMAVTSGFGNNRMLPMGGDE